MSRRLWYLYVIATIGGFGYTLDLSLKYLPKLGASKNLSEWLSLILSGAVLVFVGWIWDREKKAHRC